jgi:spermidine synthase
MTSPDRTLPLVGLCFFFSGLAALIYQTAWTREFAFVFGTSDLAVATVLAAYMGGLAAGAAIAGRIAHRLTRPVLAYGVLELGIALAALCVPFGIAAARWLYVSLFGGTESVAGAGGLATALFYLACSFVILLVPTAMMGATLPLLARHAVREEAQIGSRIGLLYAANSAGAVVGTLVGAFLLLPNLGLRATIAAAAGVNALVFLTAWVLARRATPLSASTAEAPREGFGHAAWILPLILASGFVSFSYEVLWVRLLGQILGGTVQAFSTMLASFLAGIALGSAVAARFATSARRAAAGFAWAQLGIASLSALAFQLIDRLPDLADRLQAAGAPAGGRDAILAMAILFPAAICIGATFPFAVRVLARTKDDAGPASARTYAFNTVGSIAGSVCAGFFLIPGLGFEGTLIACVAINLLLAAAAGVLFEPRRPVLLALATAGGLALAVFPPGTPWSILRHTPMGEGVHTWGRIQYFGVGRSATVMLTDQGLSFGLRTNGLPEAGVLRPDTYHNRYPLTRWLGALPALARPDARSLLLVGFGGGMALELVPSTVEQIDVVELEPEVIEANRSVSDQRWRDPLADPRVTVHINDARNALLLSEKRFDAIVSQPSHPWAGGAAHLYTHEFFSLVRSRLSEGGVFVQWIGTPFVDEALFRSLLATLSDVFPHVRAYEPPPGDGVLFLASSVPLDMERNVPRAIASAPEDYAALGLTVAEDVAASLLLDEAGVRALAEGAPLNRDGHNRLQNRSARLGPLSLRGRLHEFTAPFDPLVRPSHDELDVFYVLRRLGRARALRVAEALEDPTERDVAVALTELSEGKRASARRRLRGVLETTPRHAEARAAMLRASLNQIADGTPAETLIAPPLDEAERSVAAGWRAGGDLQKDAAPGELDAALARIPLQHPLGHEAALMRIRERLRGDDPEQLREAMRLVDASMGDRPDARSLLLRAEAYSAAGEHGAALETLILLSRVARQEGALAPAFLNRARQVALDTPTEPELRRLRQHVLRRVGG